MKNNTTTPHPHELYAIGQKILLFDPRSEKFLLVKDAKPGREEHWGFLGGRINQDEDAKAALDREVHEEAGTTLKYTLLGLVDCERVGTKNNRTMMLGFLALYQGGEITLSSEHSEYRWQSLEEIKNETSYRPWVKRFVETAATYYTNSQFLTDVKRLQADFENYKKRVANDEKELYGHLVSRIASELIPVLDNFHAATEHVPADAAGSPWVTGITYIEKQFEEVLRNHGVEPLETNPGDAFDPTLHEALKHEQTTEASPDLSSGTVTITKVVQKGYRIKDKLIRPAKVIVHS